MVERAKIERYEKCFVYEVEKRDKAQCDVSRQKRKEGWTLDRDKAYEDCVLIQIYFGDKMTNVSTISHGNGNSDERQRLARVCKCKPVKRQRM